MKTFWETHNVGDSFEQKYPLSPQEMRVPGYGKLLSVEKVASQIWGNRQNNVFLTKPLENRDLGARIGPPESKLCCASFSYT